MVNSCALVKNDYVNEVGDGLQLKLCLSYRIENLILER
jgi:hypothetical protein